MPPKETRIVDRSDRHRPPEPMRPALRLVGTPGEPVEANLIERARSGDTSAFETLYRQFSGRVFAICLRLSGNRAQAEEWTQETFLRAWQNLDSLQFGGEAGFGSWIARIASNLALDGVRSASAKADAARAPQDLEDLPLGTVPAPAGLKLDLERAIAALPPAARTVFVLHHVEGWPHEEIAHRMGITEVTSRTQLHRARKLLREALQS